MEDGELPVRQKSYTLLASMHATDGTRLSQTLPQCFPDGEQLVVVDCLDRCVFRPICLHEQLHLLGGKCIECISQSFLYLWMWGRRGLGGT